MMGASVEVSFKGGHVKMPGLELDGRTVVATGRWLKFAAIHDEDFTEGDLTDLGSFIAKLKAEKSFPTDILTVAQRLPDVEPQYRFPMVLESVAAIRTTSYDEWLRLLSSNARADVKKAAKRGVVVKVAPFDDDFVNGIRSIYNELPVRQGRRFWHYEDDRDTVQRKNSTYLSRSTFIGAYYQDELIGFTKIVDVGRLGVMMQFLSKISHRDKRPANALVAKAVEHCAERGMLYLTYGKYHYGKRSSSLTQFKHRAGFQEFLLPRFYIPLTAKGSICLGLGLHRDLREVLPAWLTNSLAAIRAMCIGRASHSDSTRASDLR
jgi:hypothetical protein